MNEPITKDEFDVELTRDETLMLVALSDVHGLLCRLQQLLGAEIVAKTRKEIARIIGERNQAKQIAELNAETIKNMCAENSRGV
jgi:hypothetical protein